MERAAGKEPKSAQSLPERRSSPSLRHNSHGGETVIESANSQNDVPLESSIPDGAAPLESILCTKELPNRPSRPPDHEKENSALVALTSALANSPRTILQTLADKVLEVLHADSAGLSLLTKDEKEILLGSYCRRVAATHRRRHPARFRPMRRCARPQYSNAIHSLGTALSILEHGDAACRRGTACSFLRKRQSGRYDLGDQPR